MRTLEGRVFVVIMVGFRILSLEVDFLRGEQLWDLDFFVGNICLFR